MRAYSEMVPKRSGATRLHVCSGHVGLRMREERQLQKALTIGEEIISHILNTRRVHGYYAYLAAIYNI